MDLEGKLRSNDRTTITLLVGQGVNVEVNRELQSSAGLILLMGIVIVGLLYVSLRRWTDVAIVLVALGAALLWMQGMIGHLANFSGWPGLGGVGTKPPKPRRSEILGDAEPLHLGPPYRF